MNSRTPRPDHTPPSPDIGLVVVGRAGEMLFWNCRALDLLGVSEAQLRGYSPLDPSWAIFHEDGSTLDATALLAPPVVDDGEPQTSSVVGIQHSGSSRRTRLVVRAIPRVEHGAIVHVTCTLTELTDDAATSSAGPSCDEMVSDVLEAVVPPPFGPSVFPPMRSPVLVVEDSPLLREALAMHLRLEGFSVLMARDGIEAKSVLDANRVSVVVSDLVMPELDGVTLRLWTAAHHPDTQFLLCSGYPDPILKRMGVDPDVDGFLAKPFEPAMLTDRVRALCATWLRLSS